MKQIFLIICLIILISETISHAQEKGMKLPEKISDQLPDGIVYNKGWVLAIGVNEYPNLPSRFKLSYAVPDAKAFVDLLQKKYGFDKKNTIIITDSEATKRNIMEKLYSLADTRWVSKDDCVIFYFSGHGQTVPLPRGGDMGFLIPYDAKVDLSQEPNLAEYKQQCIGMNELNETAKLIPAKHIIFIIDACYSGLALETSRSLRSDIPGYLSKVAKTTTQQIIAAGGKGEESEERADLGHGVFTHKLLEGLETEIADMNNDGVITGTELANYLSDAVRAKTNGKQNPQWRKADEGEFLFLPQISEDKSKIKIEPVKSILTINSNPEGADVYINGQMKGKTPYTYELLLETDGKEVSVSVSKEGYETKHETILLRKEENIKTNYILSKLSITENLSKIKQDLVESNKQNVSNRIVSKDGAIMVLIPKGDFLMGSDDSEYDEKPAHKVFIDNFYIDIYEVTNAQYKKFLDEAGYDPPGFWNNPSFNAPDQPVVGVSWNDAIEYCKWAGKRLPTEAEWEKAARGGLIDKKYPWGDNITYDNANYFSTGGKDIWNQTSPVGSFAPNGFGLYDILGNVWEWCSDWYSENYYSESPTQNPQGPKDGYYRVLRGGAWNLGSEYIYITKRYSRDPNSRYYNDQGFRCVMDAK
ncbi:MAG: SUMF1/EgtB/PvdO family nonheme iron enzyme [bacterium]